MNEVKREKIKLEKVFSREHPLFCCYVWHDSNFKHIKKWLGFNVKNILFLRELYNGKISIWYDSKELNLIYQTVSGLINKNKNYFGEVVKEFYKYWNLLLPYCIGKKKIKNVNELKKFYENWVSWWSPMAVIFITVDLENILKEIRNKALRIRAETEKYSEEGDNIFFNFFNEKFLKYRDIARVISPKETFNLCKNKKLDKLSFELIKKRLNGYAIVNGHLLYLKDLDKFLSHNNIELKKPEIDNTKEIKGVPASPGFVKGRIRKIQYKSQLSLLKKGEILVTEMTSPDYIFTMKKSAAIITDEGGMTSHAAIVSRELGKPCIVGTRIATKILKDGDLVEVDANNGIVRILKRK